MVESVEIAQPDSCAVAEPCGLYVDVENLGNDAEDLVASLIADWPCEKSPRPTQAALYVRADMTELWNVWIAGNLRGMNVEAKGIQHFTAQGSKNSADIAIAVDAMTALLKGEINYVAVLSDDSDFISLFTKVRKETSELQARLGRIPFLWIVTTRSGTRTSYLERFFPKEYVHFIQGPSQPEAASVQKKETVYQTTTEEAIAQAIIRKMPLGPFKSTDCRGIIEEISPGNDILSLEGQPFTERFFKIIWPCLQSRGVTRSKNPPRYQNTQAAKDSLPD